MIYDILSDNSTVGITNRLAKGNELRQLLCKNGAIISSSVSLHDYTYQNQGLGLKANHHIKKYDTIASIPIALTISYANPYISSKFDSSSNDKSKDKPKVLSLLLSLLYYYHHYCYQLIIYINIITFIIIIIIFTTNITITI